MKKVFISTMAAATALGLAVSAIPAAAAESVSVNVPYADLDLSTEEGMDVLRDRLDKAAREVCGFNDRVVGSRLPTRDARNCYVDMRDSFERQITRKTGIEVTPKSG